MTDHDLTITTKEWNSRTCYGWRCACGKSSAACNYRELDARSSWNMHVGQSRRFAAKREAKP